MYQISIDAYIVLDFVGIVAIHLPRFQTNKRSKYPSHVFKESCNEEVAYLLTVLKMHTLYSV